jgi:glutamate-1-semialdehyde 2,1-aminomutase
VQNYAEVLASHTALFKPLFHALLERGVYLPPSPFETCFLSAAHTSEDIAHTCEAFEEAFARL